MEPSLSTRTRFNNALRSVFKLPGLEPIMARITRGRVPTSLLARLAPNHYQYEPGSRRVVRRSGVDLELDISDFVDWCAYFGLADPGQDAWFEHIKPDQVVVDVGANNGYLSLRLGRRVGQRGKVIAFEPHPGNVLRFLCNHSLNLMAPVELAPLGLGDQEGESTMIEVDDANAGMNRIVATVSGIPDAMKTRRRTVRVTTLDAFLNDRTALALDWIKIDVEGYEARVLRGAATTITRCRPGLFIEVDDANLRAQSDSAAGLLSWVEERGYEILDAATSRPIASNSPLEGCHFDALCIHPERTTEVGRAEG